MAPGADLRTDVPRYRIWRDGELVEEPADASEHWRDDLVGFLIGCSFTFERALRPRGCRCAISSRASTCRCTAPASTALPTGRFSGPLVVSMRPMTPPLAIRATQVT